MNSVSILFKDTKVDDFYKTEIVKVLKDPVKAIMALEEAIRNDPNSAYNKKDYTKVYVFYYVHDYKVEE